MERRSVDAARTVRYRTDHDLDACVRALAEVHERDGYPVNWPERPGAWLTQPSLIGSWVAELEGRVVGQVCLSRSGAGYVEGAAPGLWGAGATAVVGRLFVSPSARGHGLGALLLARAVAKARQLGLHPVLDVVASDAAAVALYERLGWELLGTVEQEWGPEQRVVLRCYAAPAP